MFSIRDFSAWKIYEGFSEGSGRSEKQWLQSSDGDIGLFKWPKVFPQTGRTTYEHISEHLAHQIGEMINIPTANVEIGEFDYRIGSMSYLVNESYEELREGAWFLLGKYPHYDINTLRDRSTGQYYSIQQIFSLTDSESIRYFWLDMMVFDYLIGNRDRHQNNWAFLLPIEDKNKRIVRVRPCPLYDNGSSLCCYVEDSQIDQYLGRDLQRINSLVDTQSKSIIRLDPNSKRLPSHSEVVRFLINKYPYAREKTGQILEKLTDIRIRELLDLYPDELLPQKRKELLLRFLTKKIELLDQIRSEAQNG